MSNLREGLIFGACNPLLDISAKVSVELLEKYNLKPNSAILGEDDHLEIYEDIKQHHFTDVEYIPGGSAQNALRTASWILNYPNVATFMGCVGKDQNADIMKQKAKEVGLNTIYQVTDKARTGTCAVLITGKERSLVAHLAAANLFSVEHLDNDHHWSFVEKAKILYISGFFFTVCPEAILRFAKFALDNNRTFSINLSAPFISQFFNERILDIMPYVDLLCGNEDEAVAFAKFVLKLDTSNISDIVKAISEMPKLNKNKRTVIITQGENPVIYIKNGELNQISVPKIDSDKIIDTNGAGDAFMGGFLAQFVQDKSIEKCIDCGIWASGLIIQRSGCTFPEKMEYK